MKSPATFWFTRISAFKRIYYYFFFVVKNKMNLRPSATNSLCMKMLTISRRIFASFCVTLYFFYFITNTNHSNELFGGMVERRVSSMIKRALMPPLASFRFDEVEVTTKYKETGEGLKWSKSWKRKMKMSRKETKWTNRGKKLWNVLKVMLVLYICISSETRNLQNAK